MHLKYEIQITKESIISLTSGFELIKVIESQFNKLMANIGLHLSIFNRVLVNPIHIILKKVAEKAQKKVKDGKSSNEQFPFNLYKNLRQKRTPP